VKLDSLVYFSRIAAEAEADTLLDSIRRTAQPRNHTLEVSGVLVYAAPYFAQYLEGEAATLDGLYDSIRRDSRHLDIELMRRQFIVHRAFPNWSMEVMALSHAGTGYRRREHVCEIQNRLATPLDVLGAFIEPPPRQI
jgi:hypothetical protein